ncbi:MAG: M56 family metallopeptidase [Planctomycetota bacterium]
MSVAFTHALGEVSLHVAGLVALAWLLERVLGRALSPRLRLGLWLVVVARLALPALPEVPRGFAPPTAGLARLPSTQAEVTDRARRAALVAAPTLLGEAAAGRARKATDADAGARASRARAAGSEPSTTAALQARAPELLAAPSQAVPREHGPDARVPAWQRPLTQLALVGFGWLWLAGVLVSVGRLLLAERRLRASLKLASEAPREQHDLLHEIAQRVGLARAPRLLITDALASPAVHGWRRPTVLVPTQLAELPLNDAELRCVLAHECCHVRRGDLALVPLIALLRAVWWFHPLARLALARVTDALEETRDADALAALAGADDPPNTPSRVRYARVLVRLAEAHLGAPRSVPESVPFGGAIAMAPHPRGLTRRVHMILEPRRQSLFVRVVGTSAIAGLGWLGLVAAAPTSPRLEPRSTGPNKALAQRAATGSAAAAEVATERVQVELPAPPPAWRTALEARLDARLAQVDFEELALPDALRQLAKLGQFEVALGESVIENEAEYWTTLRVQDVTAREVLQVLCEYGEGLIYDLADGGVVRVDRPYEFARSVELRLYKVGPLLEALRAPFGQDDVGMDQLVDVILNFGIDDAYAFDMEGTSISEWEGLLCIRQTPAVHNQIHALLERLASRQLTPAPRDEPWRPMLEQKLATKLSLQARSADVAELIESIATQHGVAIIDPEIPIEEYANEGPINVDFVELSVADALRACLAPLHLYFTPRAGGIEIQREPAFEVHLHPIGPLLSGLDEERRSERFSGIEEFMRDTVDPESWDMYASVGFVRLGDLLVVRQTPENQAGIVALLAQLERALAR